MLEIHIPNVDGWNPKIEQFVKIEGADIVLEHSLVSLKKWEAKHKKPYLHDKIEKTDEEIIDYIRCMTITKNVNPELYYYIPKDEMERIVKYINDPMTATTFHDARPHGYGKKEIVTAEVIYFMMINYGIPIEFQKWHLNQLMTLIRVCEIKMNTDKKSRQMSMNDIYAQNKSLNAQRRAMMHSKG